MVTFFSLVNSPLLRWTVGRLRFHVQSKEGGPQTCGRFSPPCWPAQCLLLAYLPTPAWFSMEKSLKAETPVALVLGTPLPAEGFMFLSEVSWYKCLTPSSRKIVDVVKTTCRMLFFRPPSASQQPRECASSLCQTRWEIRVDLVANPRLSQKKH